MDGLELDHAHAKRCEAAGRARLHHHQQQQLNASTPQFLTPEQETRSRRGRALICRHEEQFVGSWWLRAEPAAYATGQAARNSIAAARGLVLIGPWGLDFVLVCCLRPGQPLLWTGPHLGCTGTESTRGIFPLTFPLQNLSRMANVHSVQIKF